MTVLSVVDARDNGTLIAEAAKLWLPPEDVIAPVLDLTYGKGNFWTKYRPYNLITNDLDPSCDTDYHYDFHNVPESWYGAYEAVVFDPPYVSKGGRDTSTIPGMDLAYGLMDCPKTPTEMYAYHERGIIQAARCLRPGGRLLVKTMDYISSGRYWSGYWETADTACTVCDLELADVFVHHSGTGPQPKKNRDGSSRRQVHSRRSHSYLMVFTKGRK